MFQIIKGDAELLLAADVMDNQGDLDFCAATETVLATHVSKTVDKHLVGTYDPEVGIASFITHCTEALNLAEHAFAAWSPARRAAALGDLTDIFEEAVVNVKFAEGSLRCIVHASLESSFASLSGLFKDWTVDALVPEVPEDTIQKVKHIVFGDVDKTRAKADALLEASGWAVEIGKGCPTLNAALESLKASLAEFDNTATALKPMMQLVSGVGRVIEKCITLQKDNELSFAVLRDEELEAGRNHQRGTFSEALDLAVVAKQIESVKQPAEADSTSQTNQKDIVRVTVGDTEHTQNADLETAIQSTISS